MMVACVVLAGLVLLLVCAVVNSIYAVMIQEAAPWWSSWAGFSRAPVFLSLFLIIAWLAIVGKFKWAPDFYARPVSGEVHGHTNDRLFVLIHGLGGSRKTWQSILPLLAQCGDVLPIDYPAEALSNADPVELAHQISDHIEAKSRNSQYSQIVLVGHSIGALITRRMFLDAAKQDAVSWVKKTRRIVLLAGTNRGWDISGQKPADMRWANYAYFWVGSWFGRLAGVSQLVLATETGAPFVANLRLEWMRWFHGNIGNQPEVVQLLGDIDDIVSEEDNKDLRVTANGKFIWLRVRGTGHKSIVFVTGDQRENNQQLATYRAAKIKAAAVEPLETLREQNEELPYQTDLEVIHLVFILHGIRDLGEWAAHFEEALRPLARKEKEHIAIASVRYGYFGMGPFVLRADRQKYVRWFMDEYTETLARYPNVKTIDFIGHSNGTYLLASALQNYASLRINKIMFAGSVVPTDYNWQIVKERGQVDLVKNYVAADDWVVALFPRVFELPVLRALGNDIGSAGFNGFDKRYPFVENVEFVTGQHSAFLSHIPEIVHFIFPSASGMFPTQEKVNPTRGGWETLKFISDWFAWVVWFSIAILLVWVGVRVTGSATQPTSIALLFYVILMLFLLRGL
jgi:pimeloyl-ACP methyl ester carboxylesterase